MCFNTENLSTIVPDEDIYSVILVYFRSNSFLQQPFMFVWFYPGRGNIFFLLQNLHTSSEYHLATCSIRTGILSRG